MTTDADTPAEPEPPALVVAEHLGLRGRRGWVFRDVDLRVPDGAVTALTGPSGSGRSMLLLSLAGRARPTEGTLTVAGHGHRSDIRRAVAVARVTGAAELEPELQVVDHIREGRLLHGDAFDFARAQDLLGLETDPTALVDDLPTDQAVLLAVALALAVRPKVIVVDDVDIAASAQQQDRIWRAFGNAGTTVIATTVDGERAAAAGATVVTTDGGRH